MVSQNDDPKESRPPTLKDLVDLCRHLNQQGAKYIVIGGMAVVHHGFVRATEDIDLLIETSPPNEKAVIEAVAKLPDHAAREIKPGEVARYEVIRVADEIVVDLMGKACGIAYSAASKKIVRAKVQGVEIPFASVDLMIDLKKSIRPKDQLDSQFLKTLKEGG